jgi:hypothetical protein
MRESRNVRPARRAAINMKRGLRAVGTAALITCAGALIAAPAANAGPVGMVCENGSTSATTTTFDLTARTGYAETPDGNSAFMWGYSKTNDAGMQLPGPVLCVSEGTTVKVILRNPAVTNRGAGEPISMVFPGQGSVTSSGGSAGLLAREAPVNDSVTYTFTASNPGTYLYESGTDPAKQVEMGLYGALVVRPAGFPDRAYASADTRFDPAREYILVFAEIDPELHSAVERSQPYDITKLHNRYFQINGRSFPDTLYDNGVSWLPSQPYGALVRVQPYNATSNPRPALIRMINAGLSNHPFHPHGNHLRMIAQDGRRFVTPGGADASSEHFGETIPSGATLDMLLQWTDQDGYSPSNALPITMPSYNNLTFKDKNTFYGGSPYLGYKGTLPTTVNSQNVCGEQYFPWHSHALNEFANFEAGFGGMATMLRLDPLGGCFGFPVSTKIDAGSLGSGSYASLGVDDANYYVVNSTTTGTRTNQWYAGFSGIPAGFTNLKVTYKGRNSISRSQVLSIWNWTTAAWVAIDTRTVGNADVLISNVVPPGTQSQYRGTGASAGQVRVRVSSSGGTANYTLSGNLVTLVYDAP